MKISGNAVIQRFEFRGFICFHPYKLQYFVYVFKVCQSVFPTRPKVVGFGGEGNANKFLNGARVLQNENPRLRELFKSAVSSKPVCALFNNFINETHPLSS